MAQAFRSTRAATPQGVSPLTLVVDQGIITEMRGWGDIPSGVPLREFGDMVLLPGLVDSHVHINEPGRTEWEGFWTATRAAASGGVTTVVDMPLNCVPETIATEALETKRASASAKTWVDWAAWGGVVRGNCDSLLPLAKAGVPGFKCFLVHSGIDGFAWVDESNLRLALIRLRGTGLPLLAHAEVAGPIDRATEKLNAHGADWRNYRTYLASRPEEAELEAITLLIRLAEEFDSPVHIVHLASARAVPLLAQARLRGTQITVETCTQYLHFAAEEIPDGATEFKCAPPIRGRQNRDELWAALAHGVIDFVATDHSPCPPEMKRLEQGRWDLAWGGISSLGLALPVLWTGMKERGVGLEALSGWLAAGPARLAGISERKGSLKVGADADFAVFDPESAWTVLPESLYFRHALSPFLGSRLHGIVRETWLRGEVVYREGQFLGQPRGRELVRP